MEAHPEKEHKEAVGRKESAVKSKPEKVWLILGHRPSRRAREVAYPTDPRYYNLPLAKPVSDEQYARVSNQVKAFSSAEDAIDFCYDCGLLLTRIVGYRLVGGEYQEDQDVTDEVLDTDW